LYYLDFLLRLRKRYVFEEGEDALDADEDFLIAACLDAVLAAVRDALLAAVGDFAEDDPGADEDDPDADEDDPDADEDFAEDFAEDALLAATYSSITTFIDE
jgi:hypothetical protein